MCNRHEHFEMKLCGADHFGHNTERPSDREEAYEKKDKKLSVTGSAKCFLLSLKWQIVTMCVYALLQPKTLQGTCSCFSLLKTTERSHCVHNFGGTEVKTPRGSAVSHQPDEQNQKSQRCLCKSGKSANTSK